MSIPAHVDHRLRLGKKRGVTRGHEEGVTHRFAPCRESSRVCRVRRTGSDACPPRSSLRRRAGERQWALGWIQPTWHMPRSILLQPQARSSLEAPPRTGAYRRRPWPPCRRRRLWSPDDAAGASLRTTSVRPYPPVRQGASEGRHVELPFWLLPCTAGKRGQRQRGPIDPFLLGSGNGRGLFFLGRELGNCACVRTATVATCCRDSKKHWGFWSVRLRCGNNVVRRLRSGPRPKGAGVETFFSADSSSSPLSLFPPLQASRALGCRRRSGRADTCLLGCSSVRRDVVFVKQATKEY